MINFCTSGNIRITSYGQRGWVIIRYPIGDQGIFFLSFRDLLRLIYLLEWYHMDGVPSTRNQHGQRLIAFYKQYRRHSSARRFIRAIKAEKPALTRSEIKALSWIHRNMSKRED